MEGEPKQEITTEERWAEVERIDDQISELDDKIEELEAKRTALNRQRVAILKAIEEDMKS